MPAKKTKPNNIKKDTEETIKQRAFLAAYAEVGNISQAANIAKINRCSHYDWMKDEDYQRRFHEAHIEACEHLEAEARRRAVKGVAKPVFFRGEECGYVQEYSDTLLMFLMKGAMPGKYADRVKQEHTGKDGGPIAIDANMTIEEIDKKIAELESKKG